MKKDRYVWIILVLVAALLAGCGNPQGTEVPPSVEAAPSTEPTASQTEASQPTENTEADSKPEDATPYEIDMAYAEQIDRYYTALTDQWKEGQYFENDMSALASYFYEGNPLDNVGFAFIDLDNDGSRELIIGAIQNAEQDPVVFEIWTLSEGEPVMLAQSGQRNRFYLEYMEEDNVWFIANEAENGAANNAVHYFILSEGNLAVMQAIIFDSVAGGENPWFMAYDTDWDTSNDTPVDADMANAIIDANRNAYIVPAYIPYSLYK